MGVSMSSIAIASYEITFPFGSARPLQHAKAGEELMFLLRVMASESRLYYSRHDGDCIRYPARYDESRHSSRPNAPLVGRQPRKVHLRNRRDGPVK